MYLDSISFFQLLRNKHQAKKFIDQLVGELKKSGWWQKLLAEIELSSTVFDQENQTRNQKSELMWWLNKLKASNPKSKYDSNHQTLRSWLKLAVAEYLQDNSDPELENRWPELADKKWSPKILDDKNLQQELTEHPFYKYLSQPHPKAGYPDQGLVKTPHDNLDYSQVKLAQLDDRLINQTLRVWLYYLLLFNHPTRLSHLFETQQSKFSPPTKKTNNIFENAQNRGTTVSIADLSLHVGGGLKARIKRSERFLHGPFVKLGRQARSLQVGSANPEIFGSTLSIASMIQAHCLAAIPRDGFFANPLRQADLAQKVFQFLATSPILTSLPTDTAKQVWSMWRKNAMGVLEADAVKAVLRAQVLYQVGVRTFRVYSPEPSSGPVQTVTALRKLEQKEGWDPIEIFAGQVVSVKQAQKLEAVGTDGIFIGIGGGGRCITGVRSGSAIDWPQLLWQLRGQLKIPVIVEGGASNHTAQTLALGASGIGVTRAAGSGTIESPGGKLFIANHQGRRFKVYGGEASARVKYMGGREGPFDTIPYIEGESTLVYLDYGRGNLPTLVQKLFLLFGDAILAMVFQNCETVNQLQHQGAHNLKLESAGGSWIKNTH